MEPTIHDGDSLLVDTSQTTVQDGKVYALWYDGGERVKRLFRLPGGGLRIVSDNPRFPTVEVQPSEIEHVRVIGRVVHRSGTGPGPVKLRGGCSAGPSSRAATAQPAWFGYYCWRHS
jgi:phage repressor protein C with HTH and peptisase S24 domain